MDAMYWLMLVSRVLHVLSAVVLVGGVFYLRMVVAPGVPAGDAASADLWFAGRRSAWAKWVGIATLLLLVSGLFNYIRIIQTNEPLGPLYHALLGVKFLLAPVVFGLAAVIAGKSATADRLRQNMTKWLGVCLAAGLLTVALGSVVRSLPHVPKVDASQLVLIQPASSQPPR